MHLRRGLEVGESGLEENRVKIAIMMAPMINQATYQGYKPTPTGKAPNSTDTTAMIREYS